jgi:hypothetical protein
MNRITSRLSTFALLLLALAFTALPAMADALVLPRFHGRRADI